jgi:hypothetical protein
LAFILFNSAGQLFRVHRRPSEAVPLLRECKGLFEKYEEVTMVEHAAELLNLARTVAVGGSASAAAG